MPLFKKSSDFENVEFRRVAGAEIRTVLPAPGGRRGASVITLAPMRSLSLDSFAFPFANATKVREALRLQVMPYSAAGDVEIFPVVLERAGRGASGIAWYVSPEELNLPPDENERDRGGAARNTIVWPAPLPLVSQVDGTGVALWADEENLCSLLWQNDRPVLSRWRPRARSKPESELAWFDVYCRERGLERGGSFVFDAADPDMTAELGAIVKESAARCPWLGSVNLSRTALEGAMGLERNIGLMTKVAGWVFLMGALVLGGSFLRWNQLNRRTDEARDRSVALYREVFEPGSTGRIANPLRMARDKIAALQVGGSDRKTLGDALGELGEILTENASLDIAVDILRYNAEGMDCTGSAPDMSTVLAFRRAWEGRAALSQLDNTQSVSGLGYRFDLRVRW